MVGARAPKMRMVEDNADDIFYLEIILNAEWETSKRVCDRQYFKGGGEKIEQVNTDVEVLHIDCHILLASVIRRRLDKYSQYWWYTYPLTQ